MTESPRLLLPVPEAAQLLGISKAHLWAIIAEGEIRTARIGRRRLIHIREIHAFAERAIERAS